jgi:hypothetical protein
MSMATVSFVLKQYPDSTIQLRTFTIKRLSLFETGPRFVTQ